MGGHAKDSGWLWMDGTRMRYGKGQHDTLFCRLAGNGYYATVGMHRGWRKTSAVCCQYWSWSCLLPSPLPPTPTQQTLLLSHSFARWRRRASISYAEVSTYSYWTFWGRRFAFEIFLIIKISTKTQTVVRVLVGNVSLSFKLSTHCNKRGSIVLACRMERMVRRTTRYFRQKTKLLLTYWGSGQKY